LCERIHCVFPGRALYRTKDVKKVYREEIMKYSYNSSGLVMKCAVVTALFLMSFATIASAQTWSQSTQTFDKKWSGARPDGDAPIGVMGDHTHHAGGFMLSYRYMLMDMDGNRIGTNRVSNQRVLEDFMVTPTDMQTQMHMFGLMFAPTSHITFMGMVPYVKKEMNHLTRMGTRFRTESEGLGDITFTGLIKIFDNYSQRVHLSAGMSFPTGSIDKKDATPAGPNQQLPYPMQLGSGTFDLLPGITYIGQYKTVSWGSQVSGVIRLGENDRDYSLGDRFDATAWGAWDWFNWVSTSYRLDWSSWGNIDGADPALNPAVVPTADPNLRGGDRLDMLFGLNFYVPKGPRFIKGQVIAVEFGFPVFQDLDGPQLESDWVLWLGWQYAWKF
jgi:outer membrane putative beta-barrel porin/alpha-amylase